MVILGGCSSTTNNKKQLCWCVIKFENFNLIMKQKCNFLFLTVISIYASFYIQTEFLPEEKYFSKYLFDMSCSLAIDYYIHLCNEILVNLHVWSGPELMFHSWTLLVAYLRKKTVITLRVHGLRVYTYIISGEKIMHPTYQLDQVMW